MAALIADGVELMVVGMSIVFIFLAMLVLVINFVSGLIQRYLPEPTVVPVAVRKSTGAVEQQTIAAITAAVHQYRAKHGDS
ncbi:MAG: sodium pump decarboxylase subunit gamma [Methylobacter sp.]|nr:MAG: sodium pump decarboxylase subunit gamma [Methylobacter sp.]PPD23049.1 MAG: sodium pump decarboxylase subunit gamma [Methylobacter sp.]PPD36908.1 MAG: sodium pump decarboxylase subunit gamma [Methylomonas sp.]